jgi:Tfp pilus assembly protein PilF
MQHDAIGTRVRRLRVIRSGVLGLIVLLGSWMSVDYAVHQMLAQCHEVSPRARAEVDQPLPQDWEAYMAQKHFERAQARVSAGDIVAAEQELQRALVWDKSNDEIWALLADVQRQLGASAPR